jgi:hypothetical protein
MKIHYRLAIALGIFVMGIALYAGNGLQDRAEDVHNSKTSFTTDTPHDGVTTLSAPPVETLITQNNRKDARLLERQELRQELLRLQSQLDELSADQASLQYSVDDILAHSRLNGTSPDDPQNQIQPIEQAIELQEVAIDVQWYKEEAAHEWALETERALIEALASETLQGIELISTSCGSTLCKIELSIDSNISPEEAMQKLAHHRSWKGPSFVKIDKRGQAEIYFAREGHELPTGNIESTY